jgi:hypothetical protein
MLLAPHAISAAMTRWWDDAFNIQKITVLINIEIASRFLNNSNR